MEEVACDEGPLEMSKGPDYLGVQSSEGVGGRQRQKGVCWETESAAQPRSREEGGRHQGQRIRPGPRLRARGFLRGAQVKRLGSKIWSHGRVHSDPRGETGAQDETL